MATIAGLIIGPHCLNWFTPLEWGASDHLTLELSRIVLCIQIVAVAVELPRKYMKKHWVSVSILLLPVMTCGWLIVGLFVWVLIPHFDFPSALLVSACVTATDPVLAAAVVGKGKFAERVPGHLRNLLTAESGCNDGMAFPFIFLSLGLVIHPGKPGLIIKDWVTLTILWECLFGVVLGVFLGYTMRKALAFAEKKSLIDRESFLALFVFLAFNSAGIGSMLGVDDLLVSFAAGTAFGWNGDFARKTEESHVSTVIDLLLNLSFFVYFGAIVPWPDFNNSALGLDIWRLIVLAIVVIFLRRIPAVLALKPLTPDIKTWREALFCGHFGPIGVGAIFAAILARRDLEDHYSSSEETALQDLPDADFPHYQLIACIWPIVTFVVITSIVVHGSSVAVLTLGKRLNRMAITMSFTVTNTQDQGPSWMSRLQKLEQTSTNFSLHRLDDETSQDAEETGLPRTNTIETSGIKVRPAGGAKRRKHKRKTRLQKNLSTGPGELLRSSPTMERQRPATEFLQLGRTQSHAPSKADVEESPSSNSEKSKFSKYEKTEEFSADTGEDSHHKIAQEVSHDDSQNGSKEHIPTTAYEEGSKVIIEDQDGEIIETIDMKSPRPELPMLPVLLEDNLSIHSMGSLRRHMSQYSVVSPEQELERSDSDVESLGRRLSKTISGKKAFVKKGDKGRKKYFAHQIDDLIVIENADGEIIRRYRVNRHTDAKKNRSRSGTLMNRALSYVGLKNKSVESPPATPTVEEASMRASLSTNREVIGSQKKASVEGEAVSDDSVPNNITSILNANSLRRASPVYEEDLNVLYDETDESEEDEETEVEKRRRLAALGKIANKRGDSDEEV